MIIHECFCNLWSGIAKISCFLNKGQIIFLMLMSFCLETKHQTHVCCSIMKTRTKQQQPSNSFNYLTSYLMFKANDN